MVRRIIDCALCVMIISLWAPAGLANLLVNGDFEAGGSPCEVGWSKSAVTANCSYNGSVWPPSNGPVEGAHYGTTDVQGNFKMASIFQTVAVTPGLEVRLTGFICGWAGTPGEPPMNHFIRIHNGANTSAPTLASFEKKPGWGGTWTPFDIKGTPTGSQVTVSWGFDQPRPEYIYIATHVDALVLTQVQPDCSGEPTIESVSPAFGPNDGTLTGVRVTGMNYDSTCEVVLRRVGHPDILATGEAASVDGTTLTCDLPLSGAAIGKWNIVVTKSFCDEAQLNSAFIVAYPTLTNGSFEDPGGYPDSCPTSTPNVAPTGWLQSGIASGSNYLLRDSDQWIPSCPRPDGAHYGSVAIGSEEFTQFWRVFQYVTVAPNQPLTVSGRFAGGGRSTVKLQLLEGDESDDGHEMLGSTTIEERHGCPPHGYDWVNASVTGTPTGGLVTVVWRVERERGHLSASHADDLRMVASLPPAEVCDNRIDDDGNRRADCVDPACASFPGCSPGPVESCANGIDDDGDLLIDCDDPDCAASCLEICGNGIDDNGSCEIDEGCEICTNFIDDNDDGLVDCEDPTCRGDPACPQEVCANGVDDTSDGLIDCADPSCADDAHCQHNTPYADIDGDGDVDQADFGLFQLCYEGQDIKPVRLGCGFLDRDNDADIDESDFVRFSMCYSGPMVFADPACEQR